MEVQLIIPDGRCNKQGALRTIFLLFADHGLLRLFQCKIFHDLSGPDVYLLIQQRVCLIAVNRQTQSPE